MGRTDEQELARIADMLAAMGAEPRLRIVRLLLEAHPRGMIAGAISAQLAITPSTLSHHLDRLKRENVVSVHREGTSLRYTVNARTIEHLVGFLSQSAARAAPPSTPGG